MGRSFTSSFSLDERRELLISTSTRGMSSRKPVACMWTAEFDTLLVSHKDNLC